MHEVECSWVANCDAYDAVPPGIPTNILLLLLVLLILQLLLLLLLLLLPRLLLLSLLLVGGAILGHIFVIYVILHW